MPRSKVLALLLGAALPLVAVPGVASAQVTWPPWWPATPAHAEAAVDSIIADPSNEAGSGAAGRYFLWLNTLSVRTDASSPEVFRAAMEQLKARMADESVSGSVRAGLVSLLVYADSPELPERLPDVDLFLREVYRATAHPGLRREIVVHMDRQRHRDRTAAFMEEVALADSTGTFGMSAVQVLHSLGPLGIPGLRRVFEAEGVPEGTRKLAGASLRASGDIPR